MKKITNNFKSKKAITLISLVVTIVILVILAAVAINMAIGNNGLFNKAKLAKEEYTNSADKERKDIDVLTNDIDTISGSRLVPGESSSSTQPTGIKTNIFIKNEISSTAAYASKTSKSGLTLSKDSGNLIDSYLSHSTTDGYTVLKGGWYFIVMENNIKATSTGTDCYNKLYINNTLIYNLHSWETSSGWDPKSNCFPIYLETGTKFYFESEATNAASTRKMSAICYPMF